MWFHLRYALRNLSRNPVFTLVALGSIAIGIGANTAIFTLLDRLLLRPLATRDAGRLVQLDLPGARRGMVVNDRSFSYPMYRALRDRVGSFEGLWGQFGTRVSFTRNANAEFVQALLVTGNYFEQLGLVPAAGRLLGSADDVTRNGHPVAVVSYAFWKNRLGGQPGVLDQAVLINGAPYTIVGVAPESWHGTDALNPPDLYVPMAMKPLITPTFDGLEQDSIYFLHLFGRLRPGVSPAQAAAEINAVLGPVLTAELERIGAAPARFRERFLAKKIVLWPAAQGNLSDREQVGAATWTLMGLVGVVLLIACANVANLLLARGSARRKEIAVRLAMGAARRQLVAQLLGESLLLALGGGLAGLLLSDWMLAGILSLQGEGARGLAADLGLDWRVVLFTLALTAVTGLLFGLAPALQSTRTELAATLKDQAGSVVAGSLWLRKGLVVVQIALSVILLAAAGLFTRTLFELRQSNPGFAAEQLVAFSIDPALNGYTRTGAEQLHLRIRDELGAVGGVRSVSMSASPVLDSSVSMSTAVVEGYRAKEGEDMNPRTNELGPAYFSTLGAPMRMGRDFADGDTRSAPLVCIVNEKFAQYFFGNANPLGRKVGIHGAGQPDRTIVGVVANSKHGNVREKAEEFRFVYIPMTQARVVSEMTFYIRTAGDPALLGRDIRAILRRLDASLPLEGLRTVREQIDASLSTERLISTLCSSFGLAATVLASIGLYGVMAFHIARRTREIGIRMALGASRGAVLAMVLREVGGMVLLGVAAGVPAAIALGRYVRSLLYATESADPLVLMAAAALLAAVALAAGWVPARRAAAIDPMTALRYE